MGRKWLKSALLGSASHDLKTPSTGVSGSSGFLYENLEIMDTPAIRSMLKDVRTDSKWFSSTMKNSLSMTRVQGGYLDINKKEEVVDGIMSSAIRSVSEWVGNHTLGTRTPGDTLLFSVDGRLFIRVLVSLLDNVFRHSGGDTVAALSVGVEDENLKFVATDDGRRLSQNRINRISDNFFIIAYERGDRQRGVGLGLTICKAIVEAQRGAVRVYNSNQGGTVFEIRIPLEDKRDEWYHDIGY